MYEDEESEDRDDTFDQFVAKQGDTVVSVVVRVPSEDAIAASAARIFLQDYDNRAAMAKATQKKLNELLDARVGEIINPIVDELLSKPIQPTDPYGTPIGEPTTLTQIIAQKAEAFLTTTVDANGKPDKGDNWRKNPTRLEGYVNTVISDALGGSVHKAVQDISKQIKEAAVKQIASDVAKAIAAKV